MSELASPGEAATNAPKAVSAGEIFWAFFIISVTSFGGAFSWIQRTVVEEKKWLDPIEYAKVFSLCQFVPGPNVVNLSVAVGQRLAGVKGSIAAFVGLVTFPACFIVGFAEIYGHIQNSAAVQGAFKGMAAVGAGLIIRTLANMLVPYVKSEPHAVPFILIAFVAVIASPIPTPIVLISLAPISSIFMWRKIRP